MSKSKQQGIDGGPPPVRASPAELAERYLYLVIPIARTFQTRLPSSVDFDDLVGAGNLGLVEASHRFDARKGTPFRAFATHRIRGAIMDSLRRIDPVSRHLRSQQKAAERATTELMSQLGRYPTEVETARQLHLPLPRWRKLCWELYAAGCHVNGHPVTACVVPAEADTLPETWPDPEEQAALTETRRILNMAIGNLPDRCRQVLQLHDVEDWTMQQIGMRLGVDASRVSQIRTRALARLRMLLASRLGKLH